MDLIVNEVIERQLCRLFLLYVEWERSYLAAKSSLQRKPDYTPDIAFSTLDRSHSGYLTISDVVAFLGNHDSLASEQEVQTLLLYYGDVSTDEISEDFRCHLTYPSFIDMMTRGVSSPTYESLFCSDFSHMRLELETGKLLARLLELEISYIAKAKAAKTALAKNSKLRPDALFEKLSQGRGKKFGSAEVITFIKRYGANLEGTDQIRRRQAEAIVARMDQDGDGQVGYLEFVRSLRPGPTHIASKSVPVSASFPKTLLSPSSASDQKSQLTTTRRFPIPPVQLSPAQRKRSAPPAEVSISLVSQIANSEHPHRVEHSFLNLKKATRPKQKSDQPIYRAPHHKCNCFDVDIEKLQVQGSENRRSRATSANTSKLNISDLNASRAPSAQPQLSTSFTLKTPTPVRGRPSQNGGASQSPSSPVDFQTFMNIFRSGQVKFVKVSLADLYGSAQKHEISTDVDLGLDMSSLSAMNTQDRPRSARSRSMATTALVDPAVRRIVRHQHKHSQRLDGCLKSLSDCCDFTLPNAYQAFDQSRRQEGITQERFEQACKTYGIEPDPDAVYLVVARYDRNGDGKLDYPEFREMLSPKDPWARKLLQVRPYYHLEGSPSQQFCHKTRQMFKKTITQLLKTAQVAQKHSDAITNWENLEQQVSQAMSELDIDPQNTDELRMFLCQLDDRKMHLL